MSLCGCGCGAVRDFLVKFVGLGVLDLAEALGGCEGEASQFCVAWLGKENQNRGLAKNAYFVAATGLAIGLAPC